MVEVQSGENGMENKTGYKTVFRTMEEPFQRKLGNYIDHLDSWGAAGEGGENR